MEVNFNNTAPKELQHSYSDNIINKEILIIGLYPPPLGGIPIHIARVCKKLINQNNQIKIIDVIKESKKRNKLLYLLFLVKEIFKYKPQILHYHTLSLRNNLYELFTLVFAKTFLRYELIIINHTPRFFYGKSYLYKKCFNFLINFIDKQILIGSSTLESYKMNGFSLKKSLIESPFLPPQLQEENLIFNKYGHNIKNFLHSFKPIILINGSQFKLWNNSDLYGFDMAIALINTLKNDFQNIGLIIAVSSIGDREYFDKFKLIISGKENVFLFMEKEIELWPLIRKCDLMIRPTISDSFAISVQEAIFLGVPAIASDVCRRPAGTIIFESKNQNDLNAKAKNVLKNFI